MGSQTRLSPRAGRQLISRNVRRTSLLRSTRKPYIDPKDVISGHVTV